MSEFDIKELECFNLENLAQNLEVPTIIERQIITKRAISDVKSASMATLKEREKERKRVRGSVRNIKRKREREG